MTTQALRPVTGPVVVERNRLTDAVVELVLRSATGAELPAWTPGAHLELEVGDLRLVRHYSLCGDPADRSQYRVAVRHEAGGRGGSAVLHGDALPRVTVRAVRNRFPLVAAPSYVFVAGGIGVTPLVPMVAAAEAAGADWVLHLAGRTRVGVPFADQLVERYGDRVRVHAADQGARLSVSAVVAAAPAGSVVYTCGPAGLMRETAEVAVAQGLTVHRELFAADDVEEPDAETSFEVHFARTGVTVTVAPGQSILDLGEAAGADVFGSCTEGICGTCETRVLEGVPRHRDSVLTGDPQDTMMVCVSRAACARLVLDA